MSDQPTHCPSWCRADHDARHECAHESSHAWLNSRLDGVTASVALLSFPEISELTPPTLVCLRLRQRDVADKDSVEMTPDEARHLAGLLAETAARADVAS